MLHLKLTESAARLEAVPIADFTTDYYASTNRTCKLYMTRVTRDEHKHLLELMQLATQGQHDLDFWPN